MPTAAPCSLRQPLGRFLESSLTSGPLMMLRSISRSIRHLTMARSAMALIWHQRDSRELRHVAG